MIIYIASLSYKNFTFQQIKTVRVDTCINKDVIHDTIYINTNKSVDQHGENNNQNIQM